VTCGDGVSNRPHGGRGRGHEDEDARTAANAQGLWVINHDDGTVSHIDPVQARVVATIPVGVGPLGIAADDTAVWVVR